MIRLAINGFGRIGRCILRAIYESGYRDMVQCVASMISADPKFKLTCCNIVQFTDVNRLSRRETLHVSEDEIALIQSNPDPAELPWGMMDIDLVLECLPVPSPSAMPVFHLRLA